MATQKKPGMMPGKGNFIKKFQFKVVGETDLETLLGNLNKKMDKKKSKKSEKAEE